MKRLAISFFYDKDGILDDYMTVLLQGLRPSVDRIIFVSNGTLTPESRAKVAPIVDRLIERDNVGFDVWAYREGLMDIGFENLKDWDEVLLFNHTFYGPIFPFSEMFDAMSANKCDFWGITSHKSMTPNPFTGTGILPAHLNSHFIAVRKPMLTSAAFKDYWQNMAPIESYTDSILKHESRFTKHFEDCKYKVAVYMQPEDFGSDYPAFIDIDETILKRSPILKRRAFFHDPMFLEENAVDLPRALRLISERSDYDSTLIWKNIIREAPLRTLNTNAALMRILPDVAVKPSTKRKARKIAVCAHVYYLDMLDELISLANNIRGGYDFIATTDTAAKKTEIEERLLSEPRVKNVIVRVVAENRGRDMSALFISCRDLFIDDRYDLVCRLHTKKSPQVFAARGNLFKRYMFDNLLHTEGYVDNVIALFSDNPWVGVALPPVIHFSYPTLGHAWFTNWAKFLETAKILGLNGPFDESTPVAAYGTMFWFRPKALRKIFEHPWKFEDFNAEPHHVDGGLAHVLERSIGYAAQDAGYCSMHIMSAHQAEQSYSMLEYKYQKLAANLPLAVFRWHDSFLASWKKSGYPLNTETLGVSMMEPGTMRQSFARLLLSGRRSLAHRMPRTAKFLQPAYIKYFKNRT